jgi:hypothetical protein
VGLVVNRGSPLAAAMAAIIRSASSGFLLKDATAAELVHAVRVVAYETGLVTPGGPTPGHPAR